MIGSEELRPGMLFIDAYDSIIMITSVCGSNAHNKVCYTCISNGRVTNAWRSAVEFMMWFSDFTPNPFTRIA